MRIFYLGLITGAFLISSGAVALEATKNKQLSQYVGEETREIKSLSKEDVTALLKGEGWGLAKPAELNGIPGPQHVLDLAEQLELSDTQHQKVQEIFEEMQKTSKVLGERYVNLEAQLDKAFSGKTATNENLRVLLEELGATISALRFAHLNAHLKTAAVLDLHQNKEYSVLRGYEAEVDHSGNH